MLKPIGLAVSLAALMLAAPAHAGPLDGLGTCTLTLSSGGTLTMAPTGLTLSSVNSGGKGAVILLVGVNIQPELVFSAPTVLGPPGWGATPITTMAITTASGVNTGNRTDRTVVRPGVLIDTITINSTVNSNTGFRYGSYTASTTVTCQSAN